MNRVPRVPRLSASLAAVLLAFLSAACPAASPTSPESQSLPPAQVPAPTHLSLPEALELALRQNRELQIERLEPRLAQLALETAGAAYDPVLLADTRWESLSNTGGFDPADFSNDAIYNADSESSRIGLTGLLPSGLSYSLNTDYAHSDGLRNSLGFDSYSMRLGASVRQPLLRGLWIDPARLGIRRNRLLVRSAEQGLHFRVLDVVQRAVHAFHELGFAVEYHRTLTGLADVRRSLVETVRRRVQAGTLTSPDESLALSGLATTGAAAAGARQNLALARHELMTLLGDPWVTPDPPPLLPQGALDLAPVDLDLATSWQNAPQHRPDLAQIRTELDRASLDIRFWRNQLLPSLDLIASYGRRGASVVQALPSLPSNADFSDAWNQVERGDAPNQGVGFIFSVPLSRRAERSQYRASQEIRSQIELRVRQHEEWIRRQIADAHAAALASRDRVDLTRQARIAAADALAAEERRLDGGRSTLFVVLQLQSDLAQARATEWRARADHLQAINRLHFSDGSLLARHRLTFTP